MIIDLKVPSVGESITEVTLSRWLKPNGSMVAVDEPICEFESDKATLELPCEKAGKLIWVAKEGDDLPIGAIVAQVDTEAAGGATVEPPKAAAPAEAAPKESEKPTTEAANDSYAAGVPSPAAAKIIAENNLSNVAGTGKDGRVTKDDAQRAATTNGNNAPKPAVETPPVPSPIATPAKPAAPIAPPMVLGTRNMRREKMSRMRRTIAKRLVSAKNSTAMLTTFNEVDMSGIMELRTKYQDAFVKKYGIKLGFMSLFAKACATVLLEMPEINAQIDGDEIIYHDYADISVAVSTPNGLVVPIIKNVEAMNLAEIERAVAAVALKARENTLTLEEMQGGTFTITNGGVFGSMMSTPIINEPQSAILGMHAIIERPVAIKGQVVVRPMMYIALSYDHRVIDGSSSVTFLVKVKQLLEDPTKLLLNI